MNDTISTFRQIKWDNNSFIEIANTDSLLILEISNLSLQDNKSTNVTMQFNDPKDRWAMLFKDGWIDHPQAAYPLGDKIVEAFVKPAGDNLAFSFAYNHSLGWSRWGFIAQSFQIKPCT